MLKKVKSLRDSLPWHEGWVKLISKGGMEFISHRRSAQESNENNERLESKAKHRAKSSPSQRSEASDQTSEEGKARQEERPPSPRTISITTAPASAVYRCPPRNIQMWATFPALANANINPLGYSSAFRMAPNCSFSFLASHRHRHHIT